MDGANAQGTASDRLLNTSVLRPPDNEGSSVQLYLAKEDSLATLQRTIDAPTSLSDAEAVGEMEDGPEREQFIEDKLIVCRGHMWLILVRTV